MITTNTDVSKGVDNVTNTTLEDICLRDSATIRFTKLDDGSFTPEVSLLWLTCLSCPLSFFISSNNETTFSFKFEKPGGLSKYFPSKENLRRKRPAKGYNFNCF